MATVDPADQDIDAEVRRAAKLMPRSVNIARRYKMMRWVFSLAELPRPGSGRPSIEHTAGGVQVRLHRPSLDSGVTVPALLWMHGGGYVIGSPAQDDRWCARLADELGIVVAAVKYRLAPEYRYPVALDDCSDALTWLADQAFVDSERIAIGGASAGGGLAAALTQMSVDRGEVSPQFQMLVYPMLDDRTTLGIDTDDSKHRLWNSADNLFGWTSYLGRRPDATSPGPYAAPGRRADLSALPDAWLGVGTHDLFYGEDVDYAKRLEEAGATCRTEIVPGGFHSFEKAARPHVAKAFLRSQVDALRWGLGITPADD